MIEICTAQSRQKFNFFDIQNKVKTFLKLPGVIGLGVILIEQQVHPYFCIKEQTLQWQEKQFLTQNLILNIVKTPKAFDLFEFPVLRYYAYTYRISPHVTLIVLTSSDLAAIKLLAAKQLQAALRENIDNTIAAFQLLAKEFPLSKAVSNVVNTETHNLGNDSENADVEGNITIKDLLDALNHMSKFTSNYLGTKLTANYWQLTRPNLEWLENFQINHTAEIAFLVASTKFVSPTQSQYVKEWTTAFLKKSSQILKHLPKLIEKTCLDEREKILILNSND